MGKHTTRNKEQRIRKFDDREPPEILRIDDMRNHAQPTESKWEAIDDEKKHLNGDDSDDQPHQQLLCQHRMFLN